MIHIDNMERFKQIFKEQEEEENKVNAEILRLRAERLELEKQRLEFNKEKEATRQAENEAKKLAKEQEIKQAEARAKQIEKSYFFRGLLIAGIFGLVLFLYLSILIF